MRLLELDCSIAYHRCFLKWEPILYFLVDEGKIIYVGSTFRFIDRVLQHLLDGRIQFEEVYYVITPNFYSLERLFIQRLKPKYNRLHLYKSRRLF